MTLSFIICQYFEEPNFLTKTAPSTMEEENISMAHRCRELFPIMDMDDILGQ